MKFNMKDTLIVLAIIAGSAVLVIFILFADMYNDMQAG